MFFLAWFLVNQYQNILTDRDFRALDKSVCQNNVECIIISAINVNVDEL